MCCQELIQDPSTQTLLMQISHWCHIWSLGLLLASKIVLHKKNRLMNKVSSRILKLFLNSLAAVTSECSFL